MLLPRSAWRTIELDVPTRKYRTPRVYEQTITLAGRSLRQMFVQDLGHDEPTILLTNQRHTPAKALLTRYAQRMLIENALSDAVRFFHIDALSSAVGLKVDFDMAAIGAGQRSLSPDRPAHARLRGRPGAPDFPRSHQYVGGCDRQRKRSGGQLSPSRASADPLGVRPHGKAHCRALVEWITLAPDDLRWPPKYATGLGERLSVEIQAKMPQ